ncbi:MAG TPA: polysaccharide biosynthesis protein, partial [Candidatus Krumholzibacteria bacterium]|nr:polysaccharide biosynthesis protein [Candidatus Krumholzibacteria bacterium]
SGFDPEQVPIRFTGMRPGEKLHEELQADTDATLPSPHPQLLVARLGPLQVPDALAAATELATLARDGDDTSIRRRLAAILPDYSPPSD